MKNLARTRGIMAVRNESPETVFLELRASVEQFKASHTSELANMRRGMDDMAAQLAAFQIGGAGDQLNNSAHGLGNSGVEHSALASFARTGAIDVENLLGGLPHNVASSVRASMTSQSDPNGGYFVMPAVSDGITQRLYDVSPMRRLSRYEVITAGDSFEEVDDRDESEAVWVGEEEARPATATPTLGKWSVPLHEIYALQPITQRLLDDSGRDLGAWIAGKISDKFARSEGTAYTNGDGIRKPRGYMTYDKSELGDLTRPRGQLQFIKSGNASGFDSTNPADVLRSMIWKLRAPYRAGACWQMNSETVSFVDKMKNDTGDYIWRDSMTAGAPPSLLGYPVEINEDMPNVAADAFPIAFGNFRLGYCIVDRPGIKLLRDPYTNKPNVNFYAYRRTGGGLALDDCIKLLKIAD